jgi:polysaccharide deacetylase family protein (PEP-CTERM system associated)
MITSPYVKPVTRLSSQDGAGEASPVIGPVSFTVDLEDHAPWASGPGRVVGLAMQLLDFFSETGTMATFFILDEVTRRAPGLVREIAARGHEIASHGYHHVRLERLDPAGFIPGMVAARARLEDLCGLAVGGFRAPFFSLAPETKWAVEGLLAAGFAYSSSVIPGPAWIGGWPGAPCQAFRWPGGLLELPVPVVGVAGRLLPVLGGMYLRAIPRRDLRRLWRRLTPAQTLWTYCHPYDIERGRITPIRGLGWGASLMLALNRGAMLPRWRELAAAAAPPLGRRAETLAAAPFPG